MTDSPAFIKLLRLSGEKAGKFDLDGSLSKVYSFASQIWENPRLYNFVDHGIDHSYRVLEKAIEISNKVIPEDISNKVIPEDFTLSPLERFILGTGALIHDIGMQYNKYPEHPGQPKDSKEIRREHCELGNKMISDALDNNKFHSERNGPELAIETYYHSFIYYSALVGFAHSGKEYWNLLNQSYYGPNSKELGQPRRLQLLAAILRLADELDCEYIRVPELNWITGPEISSLLVEEDIAHWATCYYTRQIELTSPGTGSMRISLKWRAPSDSNDKEAIRALLQEFRARKINEELRLIEEYFKWEEETEPGIFEFKMDIEPEEMPPQSDELPSVVKEYVKRKLRPYQFGVKESPQISKIEQTPSSPYMEIAREKAQMFVITGKGVLYRHTRLKTGFHTDRYINCRELVADMDFLNNLCFALAQTYSRIKFTDILAIGTSAFRIGSLLSLFLSTRFLCTSGDARIKRKHVRKPDYTDYEKEVFIPPNSKVLVIDDILAVGSVLQNVVSQLKKSGATYIRVFCIYSLGDVKEEIARVAQAENVEIDYLVAFPDVKYEKESPGTKKCKICQENPQIVVYEE